jgi:hypothetical protein
MQENFKFHFTGKILLTRVQHIFDSACRIECCAKIKRVLISFNQFFLINKGLGVKILGPFGQLFLDSIAGKFMLPCFKTGFCKIRQYKMDSLEKYFSFTKNIEKLR